MTVTRQSSALARRLRTALLFTTAMTFGGAGQAYAQAVVDTAGTSDITINQPTASGAATAVYLKTNGGKIDAKVGTVTSTATPGAGGAVVSLETTGDKAITADFGTITTSGGGESTAVYAKTDAGNISINASAIDSTGSFTVGVNAVSNTGNIVLTGNTLVLRGTGYDANGNTGDGLVAYTLGGNANVTLKDGNVTSPTGTIAAAVAGRDATVSVDTGKTSGEIGTAVFARSTGGGTARVTTGTIEATGASVSGAVVARADSGASVINAGTTTVSGGLAPGRDYPRAILGTSKTGTTINAGTTMATGRAIAGVATAGDVTITTTGNTHSEYGNAVTVSTINNTTAAVNATINLAAGTTTSSNAATGISPVYMANITNNATLNSAGTVTGKTNNATIAVIAGNKATINSNIASNTVSGAIFANGTGGSTVNAGTTTAKGYAIQAVSALGDVVINTTGDTSSVEGNAINANTMILPAPPAGGGNITVSTAAGTTTSSQSPNAATIAILARNNATLNAAGVVTGAQNTTATIGGSANGAALLNIKEVSNTGTGQAIAFAGAAGVTINAEKVHAAGSTTNAVQAGSANGNVAFDLGSVTGSAANFMVSATTASTTGAITIKAGSVVNTSTTAPTGQLSSGGIFAVARGGVTVVAGNVESQGFAIRALTNSGPNALGDGHVSITTTGDVTSRSMNAISVGGLAKSFDITLAEGHTVTGHASAVVAGGTRSGDGGDARITNNGTIAAKGGADGGIGMTAFGNVAVKSNIITVEGLNPVAGMFVSGGIGAVSSGGGNVSIDSNSITVHGAQRHGIYATTSGAGAIDIKSVAATSDADDFATIRAQSGAGAITIASGTIVSAGNGAPGIHATSTNGGNITITSNSVKTTGLGAGVNNAAQSAEGIWADTAGAVTIDSGSVSVAGSGASGIAALARTGITINSGSISTSGDETTALYFNTAGGDVKITSGTISTTGTIASGIGGVTGGISGNGRVSVTSGKITTTGVGSYGISARGSLGSEVTSESVSATGANTLGIFAGSVSGDAKITSGSVVATRNGLFADAAGSVVIKSDKVDLTGTGEDPGVTAGFRSGQGGIVAKSGSGAISIESNSVSVAGDNRYGIYALGNGAINVSSKELTYAAKDSAGIMIIGGAGDVKVDSGTLTTTGASGSGIVARTTTGAITINADQTHAKHAGMAGDYTGDAVVAISTGGAVSISSKNASSAGLYGSAIGGVGTSVTIDSTVASASGDKGAIVFAQASGGNASVISGTINSTGVGTDALIAQASGKVAVASGTISQTGAGSRGILAQGAGGATVTTGNISTGAYGVRALSNGGDVVVNVNGAVVSAETFGIHAQGVTSTVNVAAGGSVTGKNWGVSLGAAGTLVNEGTIASVSGAAIVSVAPASITNAGTLRGGGALAVSMGGGADTFTLKTGSSVTGAIDGGAGIDTAVLNGSVATGSVPSQRMAQFVNFENLDVAAGWWTNTGADSEFAHATIRSGATFQLNRVSAAEGGISVGAVTNNGTIVINSVVPMVMDEVAISGTGNLRFIGSGAVRIETGALTYTGATSVEGGKVQLVTNLVGNIATSGTGVFELGDGGTAGTFQGNVLNNGTFLYNRSDNYTVAGNFTGNGQLTKNGAGNLIFGGNYGFTGTTTINGGSVKFTGQLAPTTEINLTSGTLDLSEIQGGQQTIGELAGASSSGVQLGSSALIVNQTSSSSFGGNISGTGGITMAGTGTLNLTGSNDYTGDTQIQGGTLKVNGSISGSTVMMSSGGTLGGNGTIGGLQGTGGNVAPGNSIGRLTVLGNIVWNPAFIYQVEVNAAGGADRIDATGTAQLGGATLQVLAESGRYRGRTNYTILTAAGGVSGKFGTITSNYAFLTPSVVYGATTVTLSLTRNDAAFASFGRNRNQAAVGTAIQALGAGNALFEETLFLQDTKVAPTFATLTGEIYAGISTGMVENASALRRSLLGRAVPEGNGLYGWGNVLGNWGNAQATGRTGALETRQAGMMGGVGYTMNGFDVSIGFAGLRSDFDSQGHAEATAPTVTGSVGYDAGAFWAKVGGSYSWSDIDVLRRSSLGAIGHSLGGHYDGRTGQIFGELGYGLSAGGMTFGPFIGLSHVSSHTDAVRENGGATGLAIAANDRQVTFGTFGMKLKGGAGADTESGLTVSPTASAAYRRAWGDTADGLSASFVGTAGTFGVLGPVIAKDAAEIGLGVELNSGRFRMSAGYTGTLSKDWNNHSAQVSFGVRF